MRHVGLLGGTFDPVHEGHIRMARYAMREMGLEKVILLPTAKPAYRRPEAPYEARLEMCRIAAENEKGMEVSALGAASNMQYTAEMLSALHRQMPDTRFTFLLGADKLSTLPGWKDAERLFRLCDFLCFPRAGADIAEALRKARAMGAEVRFAACEGMPVSGADIRHRTARWEDAPGVPVPVLCYMARRGLYRRNDLPRLRGMMNPHRYEHTLGVRDEAIRLARLHHVPIQKAARAGLLHDCAKGMPLPQMQKTATENGLVQGTDMLSSGALLHGPVGAYIARTQFQTQDEDILNAIRSHTVGRPGMSPLELTVFVADATEAGREDYPGLKEIRLLSDLSLEAAALKSLRCTQEYLATAGRAVYPLSLDAMADLERRVSPEIMRRYF